MKKIFYKKLHCKQRAYQNPRTICYNIIIKKIQQNDVDKNVIMLYNLFNISGPFSAKYDGEDTDFEKCIEIYKWICAYGTVTLNGKENK